MFIMNSEELLDKAIDYIYDLVQDDDYICEALMDIPEEEKFCAAYCQCLCKDCIVRFLKHYKH